MDFEQYQDSIIDNFKKDIEGIFNLHITSWGYGGLDFHAHLGPNNGFRDSKYFEDPTNKSYFHLTTYKNVFSIINSGSFRMYNILNSNDENELNNLAKRLPSPDILKRIKDRVYTFSCCLYDEENIKNKKLWEKYGRVATVFEFVNEAKSWDEFHFSKTYYQESESAFDKYFDLIEQYKLQYNQDFNFESVIKLGGFYKNPDLRWENEIRLLHTPPWYNQTQKVYTDFRVSDYHTGITKYVEIPLFVDENNTIGFTPNEKEELRLNNKFKDNSIPYIKIKSLIFGDNEPLMNQETFDKIKPEIRNTAAYRLGYRIDIQDKLFETGVPK